MTKFVNSVYVFLEKRHNNRIYFVEAILNSTQFFLRREVFSSNESSEFM